mmetsp:Transcript_86794/g.135891  ORF Transcript_86794/g.135891 Transcript_86794/m.135891 type:complete len:584 (+) Transcript_86794:82-1833(+)
MARRTRALTEVVDTTEVALVVEQWFCEEHSVKKKVGAQSKTTQKWRVRAVGRGDTLVGDIDKMKTSKANEALDIEVVIDEGILSGAALGPQLRVCTNSGHIFPARGDKARIYEDIRHEWNFRGIVSGIGLIGENKDRWILGTIPTETPQDPTTHAIQDIVLGQSAIKSLYEVELNGKRYPAVLKRQRPDGCFEAAVFQPDLRGMLEIRDYPSLHKSAIFEAGTMEHIAVPEVLLALDIPKANPHSMNLSVAGQKFTDHLGRVSPHKGTARQRIYIDAPRRRIPIAKQMTSAAIGIENEDPASINVGASVLNHFLSGEVRRGKSDSTRLSKWWEVQLGPFAEHRIEIEKKNRLSPMLTLSVDGEVLCECVGEDLGCGSEEWRCRFSFVGERHIDFNVYEETRDGRELETKSVITKPYCYDHNVEVVYTRRNIDDFHTVQLSVDGVPFNELEQIFLTRDEVSLNITRKVLLNQFGLEVPRKLLAEDSRGVARKIAGRVWHDMGVEWSVREGPLKETLQEKAGEAGILMSSIGSQMLEFLNLQSAQWSGGSWSGVLQSITAQEINKAVDVSSDGFARETLPAVVSM